MFVFSWAHCGLVVQCAYRKGPIMERTRESLRERKLYIKKPVPQLSEPLNKSPSLSLALPISTHAHTWAFSIMDISSPVLLKAVSDTNYRLCLSLQVWLFKSGTDSLSPGRHSDSDLTTTNRQHASVYVCVTDRARGPLSASVPVCRESRYVLIILTRLAL